MCLWWKGPCFQPWSEIWFWGESAPPSRSLKPESQTLDAQTLEEHWRPTPPCMTQPWRRTLATQILRITVVYSPFDRANDQKRPWIFSITTISTRAAHMTILLISGTTISGWRRWSRRTTSSACLRTPTPSPSPWRRLWVWTIPRRVRA